MKHARNIAIVIGLGAVVYAVPSAGVAAGLLAWLLSLAFLATLAWFGAVFYREHKGEIMGLEERARVILYGAVGLVVITLTATSTLWGSGPGTVAWFALLAAGIYGLVFSFRAYRAY